jgi:WD40 repeat protein
VFGRPLAVPQGIERFTGLAFGSMGERLLLAGESENVHVDRGDSTGLSAEVFFRYGNGRHFDPQLHWAVILDAGSSLTTVLDLATGQQKTVGSSSTRLRCCAFFPDGHRLAKGDMDGSVRIWDTSTWNVVLTLQAHRLAVCNLAVSPDGHRIATTGWDGTLKIWDGTPSGSGND